MSPHPTRACIDLESQMIGTDGLRAVDRRGRFFRENLWDHPGHGGAESRGNLSQYTLAAPAELMAFTSPALVADPFALNIPGASAAPQSRPPLQPWLEVSRRSSRSAKQDGTRFSRTSFTCGVTRRRL